MKPFRQSEAQAFVRRGFSAAATAEPVAIPVQTFEIQQALRHAAMASLVPLVEREKGGLS